MHNFNRCVWYLALCVCAASNSGCASQNEKNPRHHRKDVYVLDFVGSRPQSPAILKKGQKLYIEAFYAIPEDEMAHIWARPYWKGQINSGYQAHPLIPIGGQNPDAGIEDMWFLFEESAEIDEIRIMMKTYKSDRLIKTTSQPVEIRWKE